MSEDVLIPGPRKVPESVKKHLYQAALVLTEEQGTQNGTTALYNHLLHVCQQHTQEKKPDNDRS